jgi:trk system potassium uptake protein TrkA
MQVIVVGCGRTGAGLAKTLFLRGHDVTVIDSDAKSFERLERSFKGKCIAGVGFDRKVLIDAGIERCDGIAAVTTSDDTNILVARVASQIFRVPRVIARLYNPRKAEVHAQLGLQTIAPITWGINRIAEMICSSQLDVVCSLGLGDVNIVIFEIALPLVGRMVREITVPGEAHVAAISRSGKTFLPTLGTVLQQGDVVYEVLVALSADRFRGLLGLI